MSSHYDTYDYPSYWEGREYEHCSEVEALKSFLGKIPETDQILEIGSGYGRLTPTYAFRAKKITLADPSSKLLSLARQKFTRKNFRFVHSTLQNLPLKLKKGSVDLIVCVRVFHHLKDIEGAIETMCNLLKNRGYLILEFANKGHFKAMIQEFFKGNITFPLDISPKDMRSKKSIRRATLPFLNYHPEIIKHKLTECDFDILEVRSVSNIRSPLIKSILPLETLITLEKVLQIPFGFINFGPSIFLLAQKRPH